VREQEGDRVAERFIRALKAQLLWLRTFDTVEELRMALRTPRTSDDGADTRAAPGAGGVGRSGGPAARARAVEAPGSILRRGPLSPYPQNPGQLAPEPITINTMSTKSGAGHREHVDF
jgi:hypothetical protein